MARWLRGTRWKVRTGLIGGVAILLLVDIIWVGSAGLTRVKVTFDDLLPHHFINVILHTRTLKQFLFTEESYEKPFFTTYFKTSLFSIYLVAFLFWRPWQRQCGREVCRCGRYREAAAARDSATPQQPMAGENRQNDGHTAQTPHKEDHLAINVRPHCIYIDSVNIMRIIYHKFL